MLRLSRLKEGDLVQVLRVISGSVLQLGFFSLPLHLSDISISPNHLISTDDPPPQDKFIFFYSKIFCGTVGWRWGRGMLSVSGDIVYLFSYQQCLIYLSSTSHRPTLQVSQIGRQNTIDWCYLLQIKIEKNSEWWWKRIPKLAANLSFLLVIDISNQNFSIWHLKNIIGWMSRLKYNRLRGESPAI